MSERTAYEKLSAKHRRFVDAYCESGFNATRAAIEAGYSERTAYSQGSRLLKNAEIAAAVSERLDEAAMPANEVLARLADIARADIGDLLTIQQRELGPAEEQGEGAAPGEAAPEAEAAEWVTLDLVAAKRAGLTRHIKSISWTLHGPRVELHDSMAALINIGKAHGLFKERHEVDVRSLDFTADELAAGAAKARAWREERFGGGRDAA